MLLMKLNRSIPSEAKCKVFIGKISFHSYANKTDFHRKSFALSLAFIMRFTVNSQNGLLEFPER